MLPWAGFSSLQADRRKGLKLLDKGLSEVLRFAQRSKLPGESLTFKGLPLHALLGLVQPELATLRLPPENQRQKLPRNGPPSPPSPEGSFLPFHLRVIDLFSLLLSLPLFGSYNHIQSVPSLCCHIQKSKKIQL